MRSEIPDAFLPQQARGIVPTLSFLRHRALGRTRTSYHPAIQANLQGFEPLPYRSAMSRRPGVSAVEPKPSEHHPNPRWNDWPKTVIETCHTRLLIAKYWALINVIDGYAEATRAVSIAQ